MDNGLEAASAETPANGAYSTEIAFAFHDKKALYSAPLQILDDSVIRDIIFSEQTIDSDIAQGFYRKAYDDEPQNIYSYIEVDGKKYDIGQVAYGEDGTLANGFGNFQFLKSNFNLDVSNADIYQQYKIYGAAYDAVAYYTIEDGAPIFLCEIPGVIAYSDYDMSGVTAILSTDRAAPYTEYTVNKLNLYDNILQFTKLSELLDCDGVYYDDERGGRGALFFTYHMPSDSNQINPEDGCVYSFDNGRFILRYTPAS
jgi:predicted heme/steroid binding protein